MDKTTLCKAILHDKLTLDDLRKVPYDMSKEEVADLLVEIYYAFTVEIGEHKTNRAILACLLERWWDTLEEVK